MIPQIIHYCWFSAEMPEDVQRNIENWKTRLPDYEFIRWDFNRFPRGKSLWVDQAFDKRKYAFAADYIRLYALYTHGGIYLDSDVEVLKSYNDLLDLPYFIGQEKSVIGIEAATLGFSKGHPLLKQLLDRYENRSFVEEWGSLDMEPLPRIIRRYIDAQMDYHVITKKEEFVFDDKVFNVFTADYFSPKSYETGEIKITDDTYSIHNFAGSWVPEKIDEKSIQECSRKKLKRKLLLRRNIVIVSNSMYERHFNEKFGLSAKGPLWEAYLSEEDFAVLARLGKDAFNRNIHFINCSEAKFFDKKDLHPVARIDKTDIELHFKKCSMKELAAESWKKGCSEIGKKRVIFVCCSKAPSRKIDYLTCLLINIGKTIINW